MLIEDLISHFASELFPGYEIAEKGVMRLTRGAEYIRRATIRQRLAFVFLALVAFLAALGLEQGG